MLGFQLVCAQEQRLELRHELVGGATISVFPRAERLLTSDTKYYETLSLIAPRDTMKLYRSVLDMLAVETFPQLRAGCAAFYADQGPPLRDIATPSEILMYEVGIIKVMKAAHATKRRRWQDKWHYALCAALV